MIIERLRPIMQVIVFPPKIITTIYILTKLAAIRLTRYSQQFKSIMDMTNNDDG